MKISFDIECTPAEARSFLGLPDLTPVHDIYLARMASFATDGLGIADFERLSRAWLPNIGENLEAWRQAMFAATRVKSE